MVLKKRDLHGPVNRVFMVLYKRRMKISMHFVFLFEILI